MGGISERRESGERGAPNGPGGGGRWRARVALIVALLALLLASHRARAEPFDVLGTDWEGLSELARIAEESVGARVRTSRSVDFDALTPADGLILVHPTRRMDVPSLSRFLRDGGRVIVLDDFGRGTDLAEHFGIKRVPLPEAPRERIGQNPRLPLAVPASAHPVTNDLQHVALNHATGLEHPNLSPVLEVQAEGEAPSVVVAVAGAVGKGRLLVVGDGSACINEMMRYPDNETFARNIVSYATADDVWGKRGGKLTIVSGDFEYQGTYGHSESFFETIALWFRAMADAAIDPETGGLSNDVLFALALSTAAGAVLWVARRAAKLHRVRQPLYARAQRALDRGGDSARVALLSRSTTSRALALLEQKSALEEWVSAKLGEPQRVLHQRLIELTRERQWLEPHDQQELHRLLLRMASVEAGIASGRPGAFGRVTDAELVSAAALIRRLSEGVRTDGQFARQ